MGSVSLALEKDLLGKAKLWDLGELNSLNSLLLFNPTFLIQLSASYFSWPNSEEHKDML